MVIRTTALQYINDSTNLMIDKAAIVAIVHYAYIEGYRLGSGCVHKKLIVLSTFIEASGVLN